jgi:hypothetical protein
MSLFFIVIPYESGDVNCRIRKWQTAAVDWATRGFAENNYMTAAIVAAMKFQVLMLLSLRNSQNVACCIHGRQIR